MSLNNLKINKYEIKTEELDVLHNLDFYASSIKEEPEDFNDSATSKSDEIVSIQQSSDKFKLEIEYHDKIIKIEKEILDNNVYESEIVIEKNQMLNGEKYNVLNSFEQVDPPKPFCNELICTNEIDRIKSYNEKVIFICDICNQSLNSKKILILHIRNHFSNDFNADMVSKSVRLKNTICKKIKKSFKSPVCEKYFSNQSNYNRHVKMHYKNKKNTLKKLFSCKFCGKHFNDQSNCNRHSKIHFQTNDNKLKCDICMKSFNREYNLMVHNRKHTGVNPYKCEICQLRFYRNDILQAHKRKMHGVNHVYGQLHLYCEKCSKQFYSKSTLMRHKMIHNNDKPYTCNNCLKSYSRKDSFITHFRSKHTGEKPYICDICKKSFFEKNVLARHMKIHTKDS